MKRLRTDVAVIGTGGAGMMAALEAFDKGAEVLVVSKGLIGKGTCTSLAGGFFNASSQQLSLEEHYQQTMEAGRGINDPQIVELVVNHANECLDRLRDMGVPLLGFPRGFVVNNQGNQKEIPGLPLVQAMGNLLAERNIKSLTGFHSLELLIEEGRTAGVLGLDTDGEPVIISAPSVILATGGAGAIYLRNDNPGGIIGDGYAMALRAGCQLQDLEFIQFFPIGLAQPGLSPFLIYPPYPPEARVFDAEGRDVLQELENCSDLMEAVIHFRDTASLFFYRKHLQGGLFLDLTAVKETAWNELNSMRLLARNKIDFRRQRVGIAPTTHFFLGGLVVNNRSETSLPGLFAAGEVTGGFHGANRLGGNALTECIVCGVVAGAGAAEYAKTEGKISFATSRAEALLPLWANEKGNKVRQEYRELFDKIKKTAWEQAGVIRNSEGLQKGLALLSQMEGDLRVLTPIGVSEGLRHNQIRSALLVLRCILESSLRREESRGAFFREDYPEIDDANWRRHIRISLDGSKERLVLEETSLIGS